MESRGPVTQQALRDYFPHGSVGRRLCPMPEARCIYVRNAKAGSSTIVLWLHRVHTGEHDFVPKLSIHTENRLPKVRDVGWDTVVGMLRGEAFRFSFVRDPVRRVESAFRDKILSVKEPRWRVQVQEALGMPVEADRDLTFDQFVAALELQDPIRMNPHWRPQHLNLMHDLIDYDFVGRLESFTTDLARVRDLAGLPDVPIEVRNASTRSDDGLADGRPELLRRIRDVYAGDLEAFGY